MPSRRKESKTNAHEDQRSRKHKKSRKKPKNPEESEEINQGDESEVPLTTPRKSKKSRKHRESSDSKEILEKDEVGKDEVGKDEVDDEKAEEENPAEPITKEEEKKKSMDDSRSDMLEYITKMIVDQTNLVQKAKKTLSFYKELKRTFERSIKDTDKFIKEVSKGKKRKKGGNHSPGGFKKPVPISNQMCEFLGVPEGSEMGRTPVTIKINEYIREHNLQNPKNKKSIIPDEKLTDLFYLTNQNPVWVKAVNEIDPGKKGLNYFNLQRFLKIHFLKKDKKTGEIAEFEAPY